MSHSNWITQQLKSLLSSSKSISVITLIVAGSIFLWKKSKKTTPIKNSNNLSSPKGKKGAITIDFFFRLWKLIKIVIPSWKSREFLYICSLSVLLVARTMISISLSDVKGRIVKNIVKRKGGKFVESVRII